MYIAIFRQNTRTFNMPSLPLAIKIRYHQSLCTCKTNGLIFSSCKILITSISCSVSFETNMTTGSLVASSWKNMMEELDNTAKLIRQNADSIESKSLDALNALYAEKRKVRKLYQEEHTRILQQFTHVSGLRGKTHRTVFATLAADLFGCCLPSAK